MNLKLGNDSFPIPNLEREMLRVGRLWIRRARYRLDKFKPFPRKNTGKLRTSMKAKVLIERNQPILDITPSVKYWQFMDLGVRGKKSSPFKGQSKSPFKFKDKMPPRGPILDWVKKKKIQARGAKGRFTTYESTAYLIQRSIYFRGLAPSGFISQTGDDIMKDYQDSIMGAYVKDLEAYFKTKSDS